MEKKSMYNDTFSHIYVEEDIKEHRRVKEILSKYSNSDIIYIKHYKDIFCRNGQNSFMQKKCKSLILAEKHGTKVYKGAIVCQNFGNENFYYTSCMMNCLYDCEYCYLQGMYSSSHVVVFVNIEDIFEEVKNMLKEHSVYLCTSYDTDMTAFESLTHYTKEWINFASNVYDNKLLIEIRTKCANENVWKENKANENIIVAFTISPDETIQLYEHKTPSLDSRLKCINTAIDNGYKVRLCFDPIIYSRDFEKKYKDFTDYVFSKVNADKIYDCSAGSFRISKEYMKIMRKNNESSVVINYPYENIEGYYQYPKEIQEKIKDISLNSIGKYLPKDKINYTEEF